MMAGIRAENREAIRVLAKRRRPPVSARLRGQEAALLCQPGFVSPFDSLLQLLPLLILLQHTQVHTLGQNYATCSCKLVWLSNACVSVSVPVPVHMPVCVRVRARVLVPVLVNTVKERLAGEERHLRPMS